MPTTRLQRSRAEILVIDVQDKLLPLVCRPEDLIRQVIRLLRGGAIFNVPILATEQYPQGIGRTAAPVAEVLDACSAERFEKMSFSCCADRAILDRLIRGGRRQIIVAGIEAHVCVQQTALDLIRKDFEVAVCADGVSSRRAQDYDMALERLRHTGVTVTTVESVLFELCGECGTAEFKQMLELIK